jgi:hypothetical protein
VKQVRLAAVVLAGLVLAGSAAARPVASPPKPRGPAQPAPPRGSDRDRDKLFDNLASRLAGLGSSERVNVIIRLQQAAIPPRVAALAGAIGRSPSPAASISSTVSQRR